MNARRFTVHCSTVHTIHLLTGTPRTVTHHCVYDTGALTAAATSHLVAERLAELLERHGLADIPDTPAGLTRPWPAPDPTSRQDTPR